jgi:DNA polymerase
MIQSEYQRRAYLEALGIDVWLPRDQAHPDEPVVSAEVGADELLDWDSLRAAVACCTRCALCKSRTQTVFGVGDPDADWMIIGEAPGAEEDRRGEPFVGRAGKLLDEMLRAVGRNRDAVFIANILKCRPPNNRDPRPEESAACRQYLDRQIELVKPRIILAVGRIAAQLLLDTDAPVGRLRGTVHRLGDIPLVVTYHPAYLLRSPAQKRKSWDDLCLARRVAGELQG